MNINPRKIRFLPLVAAVVFLFAGSAFAQPRDHLTDAESELIRFHQELDKRIEVLIKAADRRFALINGQTPPSTKKLIKDEPDWGELPTGTHVQLLSDVAGILDEAITNIEDVSRRDPKNPLISRALRKLAAAANGYLTQLQNLRGKSTDADEIAAIDRAADNANQIVQAGSKVSAPAPENEKKKKP